MNTGIDKGIRDLIVNRDELTTHLIEMLAIYDSTGGHYDQLTAKTLWRRSRYVKEHFGKVSKRLDENYAFRDDIFPSEYMAIEQTYAISRIINLDFEIIRKLNLGFKGHENSLLYYMGLESRAGFSIACHLLGCLLTPERAFVKISKESADIYRLHGIEFVKNIFREIYGKSVENNILKMMAEDDEHYIKDTVRDEIFIPALESKSPDKIKEAAINYFCRLLPDIIEVNIEHAEKMKQRIIDERGDYSSVHAWDDRIKIISVIHNGLNGVYAEDVKARFDDALKKYNEKKEAAAKQQDALKKEARDFTSREDRKRGFFTRLFGRSERLKH